MHPCSSCRRHVLASSSVCPFCATPLRETGSQLGGFAGVLLGLALVGCGDDGTEPTTSIAETTMATTDPTDPTDTDASTSTGMTTAVSTESASASDYAGPEVTSEIDTTDTPEESSSSDDSGSESGSDSSGTDTGNATTDTGTAEGADYGGAAPRD
jgi:hypothetical protein